MWSLKKLVTRFADQCLCLTVEIIVAHEIPDEYNIIHAAAKITQSFTTLSQYGRDLLTDAALNCDRPREYDSTISVVVRDRSVRTIWFVRLVGG
jgi:hypothetical protein